MEIHSRLRLLGRICKLLDMSFTRTFLLSRHRESIGGSHLVFLLRGDGWIHARRTRRDFLNSISRQGFTTKEKGVTPFQEWHTFKSFEFDVMISFHRWP